MEKFKLSFTKLATSFRFFQARTLGFSADPLNIAAINSTMMPIP